MIESTVAANKVSGGVTEGFGGGSTPSATWRSIDDRPRLGREPRPQFGRRGPRRNRAHRHGRHHGDAADLDDAGNSVVAGGLGGGFAIDNPTAGVVTAFSAKNTIVAGNTVGGAAADCSGGSSPSHRPTTSPATPAAGSPTAPAARAPIPGSARCRTTVGRPDLGPARRQPRDRRGHERRLPADRPARRRSTQGTTCDIGAFELVLAAAVTPPSGISRKLSRSPSASKRGRRSASCSPYSNAGPAAATAVVVNGSGAGRHPQGQGKEDRRQAALQGRKAETGEVQAPQRRAQGLTCALDTIAAGKAVKLTMVVRSAKAEVARACAGAIRDHRPGGEEQQGEGRCAEEEASPAAAHLVID